ncbi:MAG: PHP domain-containing protein [Candidatus Omnitrophota bacterium]
MKFADLHLHTHYSDGTYAPGQLVRESRKVGLSAIAVVDHDTVEGILPVIQAAQGEDLEVLPGIELSAEHEDAEVHILGYLLDYQNKELRMRLDILKNNRLERIYKITDKLKAAGVRLNPEAVFDVAGKGTVGRLHVARAMVQEGLVENVFEAFQKYIGDRGPAYVLGFKFSPQEAIQLIIDSGGIPVLAHPYTIRDDDMIFKFIEYGLMGLEVYYPEHSQSMINFYLELAKNNNLLVTGGSDCHGNAKSEVKIGSMRIPYELVENLRQAKEKRL